MAYPASRGQGVNLRSRPSRQISLNDGFSRAQGQRTSPDVPGDADLFGGCDKRSNDEGAEKDDREECPDEGEASFSHGTFRNATEIVAESRAALAIPSIVVGIPLTARVLICTRATRRAEPAPLNGWFAESKYRSIIPVRAVSALYA